MMWIIDMSIFPNFFRLNVVEFSDDSTMLAGGFDDSAIRIWSLTPRKLRTLKTPFELARIDKEAGMFVIISAFSAINIY